MNLAPETVPRVRNPELVKKMRVQDEPLYHNMPPTHVEQPLPLINQGTIETQKDRITTRHDSRHNLLPYLKLTQSMALIAKEESPNEPTKDTKEDLKFTSEMLEKLSMIDQDRMTKQDYHHLLALDQHPTNLI